MTDQENVFELMLDVRWGRCSTHGPHEKMLSFLVILQGNENQPVLSFSVETFPLSLWLVEKKRQISWWNNWSIGWCQEPTGTEVASPHSDRVSKWNAWSLFPSTACTVKRWQWAASGVQRDKAHFSLQTRLISELAFNMDVSTSTWMLWLLALWHFRQIFPDWQLRLAWAPLWSCSDEHY